MDIRDLRPEEAAAYVRLRAEMVLDSPWAFAVSEAEPEQVIRERIGGPGQVIAGAWDGAELVGVAGMYREKHSKLAHRAHVWGVYVTPRARGRGAAGALLRRLMDVARGWEGVNSLGLAVSEKSEGAKGIYERMGFRAWGREPGAAMVEGRLYDEIHMVAMLGGAGVG